MASEHSPKAPRAAWTAAQLLVGMLALAIAPSTSAAQETAAPVLAGYDNGFVLRSADGANSLRLLGLLQLQLAHEEVAGAPSTQTVFVNRARVGLLGSVFSRDLRYMLVVEFGGRGVQLLFATIDYTVVPSWLSVRVGRFKLPFSRTFITMASQLSLIDRPLTVGPSVFGDTVDVGIALHNGTSGRFEYSVGLFSGAGSGSPADHIDPLLSVRVGYNHGDLDGYSESDLDGGPLRWGVAAAALVDFDTDGEHASYTSGTVDFTLEAHGFSLSSAFYVGAQQDGQRWPAQRLAAIGHHTQLGYVIAQRVEPVVRYAMVMPTRTGETRHDLAGGLNVYLHGHGLKLQTFVSARFQRGLQAPDVRLQSQLSLAL
jgi:hypothetical protein